MTNRNFEIDRTDCHVPCFLCRELTPGELVEEIKEVFNVLTALEGR